VFEDLHVRWKPLRDELAILAASDPDPGVAFAVRRLVVAIHNNLHSAGYFVSDLLNPLPGGRRDMHEISRADHRRAVALLEVVRHAVRGDLPDDAGERAATIDREAEQEQEVLVNKASG
jgi:hypothetical protein